MKTKPILQNDILVGREELEKITQCIDQRWLSEGPMAKQFSQELSAFTGAHFTTFAPNGTLGLFLALLALDLPKGSEIIIPTFTFYASATSAVFAGLKPVFVDVDEDTYNVLPEKIEAAITDKTSAIMAIHIYGQCCDIGSICEIAKKHNLKVIEDAAQALGVFYRGRHVGCIGDVGVFSFFSDKIIGTGEGAAITTNNEALFQKIRLLRNQGREHSSTFIHPELGMNFRITDIQAAIGLSQLAKFPCILEGRLKMWALYEELLGSVPGIKTMRIAPFSNLVPFRFLIKTKMKEALSKHLEQLGIMSRSFFYPMHCQPQLKKYVHREYLNAESLYEEGMCLPIHNHLQESEVRWMCMEIAKFMKSAYEPVPCPV